ncbi:uncharacterized protein [Phaseolus vulgaris]|uniref:uncharacterized protein isoform X1 n=1 Tax=Phaseolus vulgaris TaxID=3885 RepID=UPI0035CBB9FF
MHQRKAEMAKHSDAFIALPDYNCGSNNLFFGIMEIQTCGKPILERICIHCLQDLYSLIAFALAVIQTVERDLEPVTRKRVIRQFVALKIKSSLSLKAMKTMKTILKKNKFIDM